MRRLAGIQIDDMLKSRLAQLELDSANVQFEIASLGCVTDAAKQFLAKLPSVNALILPLTVSEVEALIEGRRSGGQLPVIDTPAKLELASSGEPKDS